jgi:ubiquitin carboxyl-terminal hydrolase 9/24
MCNILSLKTCDLPSEQLDTSAEFIDSSTADIIEQYATSNDTTLDFQPKSDNFKFVPPVASNDSLQMPQEMQIYLVGALSNRYLKELVYAFEQINHNSLTKTLEMILSCCYCNELFSSNMIHQILLHINNSSSNEIKQALSLLYNIILIEDQLQLTRFRLAIDGYRDNNTFFNGLLSIIRQNQSSDAKKSYQCVKFIVTLANKCQTCKDYLLKTASNWEWSVNWLKTKMSDSASSSISSNYNVSWSNSKFQSNEDSEIRTFQRTKSAQRTLDDATALLRSTEFDI